jgi:hypothetical protein
MPAKSKAQFRWLHTESAKKALGAAGVKEWEGATGSPKGLPEKVKPRTRNSGARKRI